MLKWVQHSRQPSNRTQQSTFNFFKIKDPRVLWHVVQDSQLF